MTYLGLWGHTKQNERRRKYCGTKFIKIFSEPHQLGVLGTGMFRKVSVSFIVIGKMCACECVNVCVRSIPCIAWVWVWLWEVYLIECQCDYEKYIPYIV